MSTTAGNEGHSSFMTEFENYLNTSLENLKPGRIVPGVITDVGHEMVTIDIGFKSEGVIPVEQFKDQSGKIVAQVGNKVEVMLIQPENEVGQVVLSKERADQFKVWRNVEAAYKSGELVSGKVIQKSGLIADHYRLGFAARAKRLNPNSKLFSFLMKNPVFSRFCLRDSSS